MIVVSLVLAAFAVVTLWWTMHAWRTPETLASTRFAAPDGDHRLTFSLLVPAGHEQAVLEHTVARLLESTHAGYEIIVIVGHDDPETAEVAHRVARSAPGRVLVVEVPYSFQPRHAGESKSTLAEGVRFLKHLAILRLGARW